MHNSSVKTPAGSVESTFGALMLGFFAAATMAALTLATGHGFFMALLVYTVSGALVTLVAAVGRLVLDAVSTRLAPAPGARRALRA